MVLALNPSLSLLLTYSTPESLMILMQGQCCGGSCHADSGMADEEASVCSVRTQEFKSVSTPRLAEATLVGPRTRRLTLNVSLQVHLLSTILSH